MSPEFEEETLQVDLEGLQVSKGNLYPQNEHDIYIYIYVFIETSITNWDGGHSFLQ